MGASAAVGGIGAAGVAEVAAQSDAVTATEAATETDSNAAVSKPSNLVVDERAPTSIEVAWDEQYAAALDGYELHWVDARSPDVWEAHPPRESGSTTVDADATSAYVDGLRSGVPYLIRVRAVDDEGRTSAPAEVEGRTEPTPMELAATDFDADEVTLEWQPAWDGWDGFPFEEYAVSLDGEVVERVGTDVGSVTLSGVAPAEYHDVLVYGADGDVQETLAAALDFRIETDPGPGVEASLLWKPDQFADGDVGDRPTVSVDGRAVTVEGAVWAANQECNIARIRDARFEDGVARVTLDHTKYSSPCLPAAGSIPYRTTVRLADEPETVVVEHALNDVRTIWHGGAADGTVEIALDDEHLDAGETTEAAIRLHGDAVEVGEYAVDVSIDRSVAEVADGTFPDGVDGTVSTPADGSAVRVTGDASDGGLSTAEGPVTLATLELTGREPGETAVEVGAVDAATPAGDAIDVGALGASLTVGLPSVTGEDPPRDPDDDGLYEDVNGDGTTNLADAGDLFQHRDADAVQANVDAYDFSGNDEIDLADVVDLFVENTN